MSQPEEWPSLTSDAGPFPFPASTGYPIRSSDVLVTDLDRGPEPP